MRVQGCIYTRLWGYLGEGRDQRPIIHGLAQDRGGIVAWLALVGGTRNKYDRYVAAIGVDACNRIGPSSFYQTNVGQDHVRSLILSRYYSFSLGVGCADRRSARIFCQH